MTEEDEEESEGGRATADSSPSIPKKQKNSVGGMI